MQQTLSLQTLSRQAAAQKGLSGFSLKFITRQIVTQLKGTLHLENAPGKGALIRVSIPLEKSQKIL